MNRSLFRTLLVATLATLAVAGCGGDDEGPTDPGPQTGTVSGRVTAGGAGVPGATLALPGRPNQTSGADGGYAFSGVPAGNHTLTVTAPAGFEVEGAASRAVSVAANGTHAVDFTLRPAAGGGEVVEVRLNALSFDPAAVTVPRGTTVRWVNVSGSHNVTPANPAQPGAWQARDLSGTQSFEHTFGTAGAYAYTCTLHAGMNGTVTVQ